MQNEKVIGGVNVKRITGLVLVVGALWVGCGPRPRSDKPEVIPPEPIPVEKKTEPLKVKPKPIIKKTPKKETAPVKPEAKKEETTVAEKAPSENLPPSEAEDLAYERLHRLCSRIPEKVWSHQMTMDWLTECEDDIDRFLTRYPKSKHRMKVKAFLPATFAKRAYYSGQKDHYRKALDLYKALLKEGVDPDEDAQIRTERIRLALELNDLLLVRKFIDDLLKVHADHMNIATYLSAAEVFLSEKNWPLTLEDLKKSIAKKYPKTRAQAWIVAAQQEGNALNISPDEEEKKALLYVSNIGQRLAFKTLKDKDFRITDWRGNVVVIIFYASDRAFCRAEMENVNALWKQHKDKKFKAVGISLDIDEEGLRRFIEAQHIEWPQYLDKLVLERGLAGKYRIDRVPFTIVLDRKGEPRRALLRGSMLKMVVEELLLHPDRKHDW